jgi:CspA family cold shock protein
VIWLTEISQRAMRLYYALLAVAVALGVAAVVLAGDSAVALLAGSVAAALLATLWRDAAHPACLLGSDDRKRHEGEQQTIGVGPPSVSPAREVTTVERGRVESWDDETGWGVLSADLPDGGVFAHFSVVEGEGYRTLKPGAAVTFDYVPAAGGPGSQDGCSYVAERVVSLDD